MGVTGAVRCSCYEDGLATPAPVPVRVTAYDELEPVDAASRDAVREWQRGACEHPRMAAAELDLGWRFVRSFYAELSERPGDYPVLLDNVPQWNGAWYLSPGDAARALEELDRFDDGARFLAHEQIRGLCLAAVRTGHHVVWG